MLALSASADSPVRIGYGQAPPYCYTSNGRPAGFLIDVFNEAARRDGMLLEWTPAGSVEENTRALLDGRLHVLPMSAAYPERKLRLFATDPWWSDDAVLLLHGDAPEPRPDRVRRIAVPRALHPAAVAYYRDAQIIQRQSAPAVLEELCRNAVDGALVGSTYIRDLVNRRPPACESAHLRILDSPVQAEYSIAASRANRSLAERLRRRLTEMTADGTLANIADQHDPISTPHATRMMNDLRVTWAQERLRLLLLLACTTLAAGVILFLWLFRSRRNLRANQIELSKRTQELMRSNADLQAFAYSVSHDLQEPVRNQALYSELLQRRYHAVLPQQARDFLDVIRSSALRTQEMMSSVLTYSRAGQSDEESRLVDCGTVLRRVLDDMQETIRTTGARIDVGPLPSVQSCDQRLHQVFHNLIGNAIKYRREGIPPVISVSAVRRPGEWLFTISDNGIGFKQEYAEKVFGLFRRLHGADQYGGTGIGLALCKRIIEIDGGRIWVESREGEGSTFYFTLPLTDRT